MKQRMKHAAETVRQVQRTDRQAQAVHMHATGSTYREIGAALHCSAATVGRLMTSAIREAPSVAVRDYRSIVLERGRPRTPGECGERAHPGTRECDPARRRVLSRVEGLFWQPERSSTGAAINVVLSQHLLPGATLTPQQLRARQAGDDVGDD